MRRLFVGMIAVAVGFGAVSAYALEDDPIKTRKIIMKSTGGAAGAGAAILKGDIPFNPAVAASVFLTLNSAAYTYGDYFPAGSDAGSKADPKIWEDPDSWNAALAKFQQDTDAVLTSMPTDGDAFKAAFGQVAANCKSCHETFRLPDN